MHPTKTIKIGEYTELHSTTTQCGNPEALIKTPEMRLIKKQAMRVVGKSAIHRKIFSGLELIKDKKGIESLFQKID